MILVIIFILIFLGITAIILRGNYLEYSELGEAYVNEYITNLKISIWNNGNKLCIFIYNNVLYK